ncbi:TetR/AcrR family transcriptional regulator [Ornithinimicrobium cerasi]|uniref:Transcriptional regulator, TetR family n=1 Tax=Ornithinimicrobium cerasi TaxID=2248773 RepID=A0A285VNK9_9MICO|nr:TetR/AcrR family transcriptional regulator [Ornithinimicrobium cerasi]SOC55645.1 transcriptional regulator, TetR family [Ornithinimicrobium cerasi]
MATSADADVPTPPRVRLPRDERRALLLEAALAAFSEHGYHATAMDDIADRAGVSKPVLYQHFDSKLDLYVALAERVRDDVVDTVRVALASTTENELRIAASLESFFEFVDRPGSGYPLVMASDMGGEPSVARILEQAQRGCAEAIGRVIQDETDLGWEEAALLGWAISSQVQTVARHWYESRSPVSRRQAIDLLRTLVWRGIGHVPQTGGAADAVSGGDDGAG